MRLSEAMLIGDTLRSRCAVRWLNGDNDCGCALGGAYLAVGKTSADFPKVDGYNDESRMFQDVWPWLDEPRINVISDMFRLVCGDSAHGKCPAVKTLEDLCDVVRAWEDELAAKGINVEQVTMIATPEATHEPAAEHSEKVSA